MLITLKDKKIRSLLQERKYSQYDQRNNYCAYTQYADVGCDFCQVK